MKRDVRILLIAAALGATLTLGPAGFAAAQVEQQGTQLDREFLDAHADLVVATHTTRDVSARAATAAAELDALEGVLAERERFSAAQERLDQAAADAEGRIDPAPWLAEADTLVQEVREIHDDPARVAELVTALTAQAEGLEQALAAHEAEAAVEAEKPRLSPTGGGEVPRDESTPSEPEATQPQAAPAPSGGGASDRGRAVLNRIGGGWVALEIFGGDCGGVYAQGCSWPGVIKIREDASGLDDARFNWLIVHEYAHQVQFSNWDALLGSPKFGQLFGGDAELLANCMASAWGYTAHTMSCSGEMIAEAGAAWGGSYR